MKLENSYPAYFSEILPYIIYINLVLSLLSIQISILPFYQVLFKTILQFIQVKNPVSVLNIWSP